MSNIFVNQKSFKLTSMDIEISNLLYWTENPRIYPIVHPKYSKLKDYQLQEKIQEILFKRSRIRELKKQIIQAGGLSEPLIVRKCNKSENYEVIEGNSRLAACRMILENNKNTKASVGELPCLQTSVEMNEKDIFSYLSILHVQGKLTWGAYENACFIKRKKNEPGVSIEEVSQLSGLNKAEIEVQIQTVDLMSHANEKVYEKFSYYEVVVKNKQINDILNKGSDIHKERIIETISEYSKGTKAFNLRKDLTTALKSKEDFNGYLNKNCSLSEAAEEAKEKIHSGEIPKKLKQYKAWFIKRSPVLKEIKTIDTKFHNILTDIEHIRDLTKDIATHLSNKGVSE